MGVANVIPGVSGGTIALITGIYPRLIEAISGIDFSFLPELAKGQIKKALLIIQKIDFPFLIPLAGGILTSILLFSKLMLLLIETFPASTYAFFGGLIVSSAVLMYKETGQLKFEKIIFYFLGFIIAYVLTGILALSLQHSLPFIFLAAVLAIMAMILPGISGAFVLLLLGQYEFLITALHNYNFPVLIVFVAGALIGLLSFSRLLNYILHHFRHLTFSFLIGLMVGSLRLPFGIIVRESISSRVIVWGIIGFMLVLGIELVVRKSITK